MQTDGMGQHLAIFEKIEDDSLPCLSSLVHFEILAYQNGVLNHGSPFHAVTVCRRMTPRFSFRCAWA